jgi:hypothetical protein
MLESLGQAGAAAKDFGAAKAAAQI